MENNTRIGTVLDLKDKIEDIRILIQNLGPVQVGVSAFELYDLASLVIDNLLFLVGTEHYRNPRKNPGVRVFQDRIDEIGNTLHLKVVFPRYITDADPSEVMGLQLLLKDLISLRRNRCLSRTVPSPIMPRPRVMKTPRIGRSAKTKFSKRKLGSKPGSTQRQALIERLRCKRDRKKSRRYYYD